MESDLNVKKQNNGFYVSRVIVILYHTVSQSQFTAKEWMFVSPKIRNLNPNS